MANINWTPDWLKQKKNPRDFLKNLTKRNEETNQNAPQNIQPNASYDPYQAVNKVLGYKQDWMNADQAGNNDEKNKAAQAAQSYYAELRNHGYGDLAKQMEGAGYKQAQDIVSQQGKTGKTAVRPYLYNIGKQYGLSTADIDNMLSYDDATGEISLGGRNIGKPYSVVDGVSYMDSGQIEGSLSDYASKAGLSLTTPNQLSADAKHSQSQNDMLYGRQNTDADRYNLQGNQFWDYLMNSIDSDAKTIREAYGIQGDRSAGNAMASSAGSNGGNLDSFAAAEGARQRKAWANEGEMAVINNSNAKMAAAQNYLNSLGVNLQGVYAGMGDTINRGQGVAQQNFENTSAYEQQKFDNSQTAQNNKVQNEIAISETKGTQSNFLSTKDNPWFNDDGTLKNGYENVDFSANAQQKRADAKAETDPVRKANLEREAVQFEQAALVKAQLPGYTQYANKVAMPGTLKTESASHNDDLLAQADKALGVDFATKQMESDTTKYVADAEKEANLDANQKSVDVAEIQNKVADLTPSQAKSAFDDGIRTPEVVAAYNKHFGTSYTVDESGATDAPPVKMKDTDVKKWVQHFNDWGEKNGYGTIILEQTPGTYKRNTDLASKEKIVRDILQDTSMTKEEKEYLIKLFESEDAIASVVNDTHYSN